MTNEVLLEDAIRKSGKKKSYLAEKIGVSPTHFGKLLRNKYEFTASQISILCDELALSSEMRDLIFFCRKRLIKSIKERKSLNDCMEI